MDDDEWWGKPDLSPSVFFFLSSFLSFTCSWLCFLWCTFEANENAPLGGEMMCFQMIRAKSYFLGHRTSIEQSQLDTNRVEIEKKGKIHSTQKSVMNPRVENQWEAVANLLEFLPLKSSLLPYDNDVILLVSLLDSRVEDDKDLWAEWHVAFAFEETQMTPLGNPPRTQDGLPLVSIIPASAQRYSIPSLQSLSFSLHDFPRSLVAPQDSSVLHLLIQARSNTSCSLMIAEMVVVLRIPGLQNPFTLSLENPNNL